MNKIESIQYVSIKKLSQLLDISENSLKVKIPNKYIINIGKSVRYDMYGVIDFFKYNQSKHEALIDEILNNR